VDLVVVTLVIYALLVALKRARRRFLLLIPLTWTKAESPSRNFALPDNGLATGGLFRA
jgi:hypothetical protein